jgi:hypothetical protein
MERVFLVCAVLGGTIFLCQFLLGLVGFGEHHDFGGGDVDHDFGGVDHDASGHATGADHEVSHESAMSWFVGILSFRTVVAGLTFFGLAGLAAHAGGLPPLGSLSLALVSGLAALYAVGWTMKSLSRLRADGTVHIESALGSPAVVYLTVPGFHSGKGKVTVTLQDRTMEYEAVTDGKELPSGATVQVVSVVDSETLSVALAPLLARTSHV